LFAISFVPHGALEADMTLVECNAPVCEELLTFLEDYVIDGIFDKGELKAKLSKLPIEIMQSEGHFTQLLLFIIMDIDNDQDYEIIHIVSVTTPLHVETKMYYLMDLSQEEADSLIEDGYKSKYYRTIVKDLQGKYQCNSMGEIVNANPVKNSFSDFFIIETKEDKNKVTFGATPFIYKNISYLAVEKFYDLNKELVVLKVVDIDKGDYQYMCKFIFD
jgi:hypothetical protein